MSDPIYQNGIDTYDYEVWKAKHEALPVSQWLEDAAVEMRGHMNLWFKDNPLGEVTACSMTIEIQTRRGPKQNESQHAIRVVVPATRIEEFFLALGARRENSSPTPSSPSAPVLG